MQTNEFQRSEHQKVLVADKSHRKNIFRKFSKKLVFFGGKKYVFISLF